MDVFGPPLLLEPSVGPGRGFVKVWEKREVGEIVGDDELGPLDVEVDMISLGAGQPVLWIRKNHRGRSLELSARVTIVEASRDIPTSEGA
jgi:hypothetical protein